MHAAEFAEKFISPSVGAAFRRTSPTVVVFIFSLACLMRREGRALTVVVEELGSGRRAEAVLGGPYGTKDEWPTHPHFHNEPRDFDSTKK